MHLLSSLTLCAHNKVFKCDDALANRSQLTWVDAAPSLDQHITITTSISFDYDFCDTEVPTSWYYACLVETELEQRTQEAGCCMEAAAQSTSGSPRQGPVCIALQRLR